GDGRCRGIAARANRRRPRLLGDGGQAAGSPGPPSPSPPDRPTEHTIMTMNVTRQVISDLWPLHVSGEASADTRALVDSFLAADPVVAQTVQENSGATHVMASPPALPPDVELQALARTRRRLWGYRSLL